MPSNRPQDGSAWTILGTLEWTADYFKQHNISQARAVAEVLLANVLSCERIDLYLRYDQPLNSNELAQYKKWIKRRVNHEPEAYIIGHKEFWSLRFDVSPAVLIPRPETECLVETTLSLIGHRQAARILELGVGSGAISVALASERSAWRYWASDNSWSAIVLARSNACRLLGEDRVQFFAGDWLESVKAGAKGFDAIIANPPYITTGGMATLDCEIREHEPLGALDGGPQGITDLARIINSASDRLLPGGYLILEMGCDQQDAVQAIAEKTNRYGKIGFTRDYSGLDRVVQLQKK